MSMIWLILIAGGLIIIQSLVFRLIAFRKLDYTRYFTTDVAYVGDKISMIEIIANRKLLPVPFLRIESRMSEALKFQGQEGMTIKSDLYHRSMFFLWGYKRVKRTHNITCVSRGYYNLDTVALTTNSIFTTMSITTTIPVATSVVVYPAILNEDEIPIPSKRLMGDVIVKRWIVPDPFLVNGIRPYMNGDSLKDIHWRASAKADEFRVKTKDYTASPKIFSILNVETSEDQWGSSRPNDIEAIEYGISLVATLSRWAITNGLEAGLATNGYIIDDPEKSPVFLEATGGEGGLKTIFETTARLVCARNRTFYTFLEDIINMNMTNMDIIILSTYTSERIDGQIQRLERMGNSVTIEYLKKVIPHEQ